MIDLDGDRESELRCRVAAKIWQLRVRYRPFYIFKLLTEWLDCYQYILPDDRRIFPQVITTDCGLRYYVDFTDLLQCHLTYDEQVIVWKLIKESSTLATPQEIHSMLVRESSNYIV